MALLMAANFSSMSRNYFASMANPATYPYGANYGALYWPGQTDTASTGYFDQCRNHPLPHSQFGPCKYTEPDSTQHTAVEPKQIQSTPDAPVIVVHHNEEVNRATISRPSAAKRKPTPVAEERKDDHYWDRRNRNNESAKKSRMARKQREDLSAFRCLMLERENACLKSELENAHTELKKLRCLLLPN